MKRTENDRKTRQRGPRWGWIGGFLGGTCWIPFLSGMLFLHGDPGGGIAGLLLCGAALYLSFVLRPWKHPETELWILYLGAVFPVFLAAGFLCWRFERFIDPGQNAYLGLSAVLPLLIPAIVLGKKTWRDLHDPPR